MKRRLMFAIALAALTSIVHAGEIKPTAAMLARARETIKPYGANGGFCAQTPLSEVKRIDERAEDFCAHSEGGRDPPHALTGEAIALQYQCHAARMTRKPYADVFNEDGYNYSEWKPLR